MAKFSQILRKIRWYFFHPAQSGFHYIRLIFTHFAVEGLLLLILGFTVTTNLLLKTNSRNATAQNQSLFFVYLKNHPELNGKLLDAYESVNMQLSKTSTLLAQNNLPTARQVLAASTVVVNQDAPKTSAPLASLSGSTVLKPNPSSSNNLPLKRDVEIYQVRGGDTLARIASAYGVTVDTIVWENNLPASGNIKPGQELKILPVSGIEYTVKPGETISGIAKKYNVDPEDIMDYNNIESEELIFPGDVIIIPNGIKKAPPTPQRQEYLAGLQKDDYKKVDVPDDYQGGSSGLVWPMPAATRLSQKFWSGHRAIDVPCRDCEVKAAGDGIVELAGWQKGYGNTIVINHGNGLKTRYAHAKQLLVSAGQSVKQRETIMISGSTGRSTGPHLHFEVKKNNMLVDPLNYVRP